MLLLEGCTSCAIVSIAFGIIVDGASIVLIVEIVNCVLGCGGHESIHEHQFGYVYVESSCFWYVFKQIVL
jgi:hypothetical protein